MAYNVFVHEQIRHDTSGGRLGTLLRRVSRAANRLYRRQVRELGLTARQAAAILALAEAPGTTLGKLAEAFGADQATASVLVDRLLAAKLVERITDSSDRRRVQLYPTEQALRLTERLEHAQQASEVLIEEALGKLDAQRLRELLIELSAALERQATSAPSGGRGP